MRQMNKKGKKAQMEMLGLAVIVVVVSIGMLYVFAFIVNRPAAFIHPKFMQKEVSQNFLIAISKTTTDCKGQSVVELLRDCATNKEMCCVENPDNSCGLDSCTEVNGVIGDTLERMLKTWQLPYRFRAYINDPLANPVLPLTALDPKFSNLGCNENKDQEAPGILHIPLENKLQLTMMLEVCKP